MMLGWATIVPGTYSVVLQYGGKTFQTPLKIQLDPRMHPAAGDLEARLALEMQVSATIDGLDRAIAAAMAARSKLPPAKSAEVDRAIGDLILLNVHSSEADVLHESKLREQLGFLNGSLEGALQRPTAAEYATYNDLRALATAGEERLAALSAP